MSKIVLYIATSLDGFIADRNSSTDWLFTDADYGYVDFYASVDALVMGRKTYEQSLSLSAGWPFEGKATYVLTRSPGNWSHPKAEFVNEDILPLIKRLRTQYKKDIWLVGGAEIVDAFREQRLIDEYIISIHPVILGGGTLLFREERLPEWLKLEGVLSYPSGLVQLRYTAR